MEQALKIDVFFDLICPWCLIGKRNLAVALERFALLHSEVDVSVKWHSHRLLPDLPREGVPYEAFYLARLGSPEAVAMRREQVRRAGDAAGISFAFDRIQMMPNTQAAHRLINFGQRFGTPKQHERLVERLFVGYFLLGENIGDTATLARIALECGFTGASKAYLDVSTEHGSLANPEWGYEIPPVSGVPYFVFDRRQALSGAQQPKTLLTAMQTMVGVERSAR
ncbi:DSBA oxidoreductase [Pandoraea eparura]|uniref:DSBA oxidoreductase n=1 Tax=Pandoraea eparura TaxID=2508291 RepID=A0A5E4SJ89_9BURK|nr:DsbA family oxidoreductase [Pandoraea eparura]VVD75780.1 DSBA oxidoreductase [Pandoraea eparura]